MTGATSFSPASTRAGDGPLRRMRGIMDLDFSAKVIGRVQRLIHELLDIFLVDPGSSQPDLDLRSVQVLVEDPDGKERRVLNAKETTLAAQKQQALREAFQDWIWKDPRRRSHT